MAVNRRLGGTLFAVVILSAGCLGSSTSAVRATRDADHFRFDGNFEDRSKRDEHEWTVTDSDALVSYWAVYSGGSVRLRVLDATGVKAFDKVLQSEPVGFAKSDGSQPVTGAPGVWRFVADFDHYTGNLTLRVDT